MDSVIRLENISKSFGTRLLYKAVNLELYASSVNLLTGANGTGKSTLLKIMAGLLKPDKGAVHCALEPERCGYLGHATFLYPGLTALENLRFWGRALCTKGQERLNSGDTRTAHTVSDTALVEVLRQVGLERRAHDRAGVFSRGMAQRLNLARLLLQQPDLLLLDEPGTGLDVSAQGLLKDCIANFRARGACIVWVSHDADSDSRMADHVFLLARRGLTEISVDSAASPMDLQESFESQNQKKQEGCSC